MRRSRYPCRARDQGRQLSCFRLALFQQPFASVPFSEVLYELTRGSRRPLLFSKNLLIRLHLSIATLCFSFTRRPTTADNFGRLTTGGSDVGNREVADLLFELVKSQAQLDIFRFGAFGTGRQIGVVAPPVQTDLLGLID